MALRKSSPSTPRSSEDMAAPPLVPLPEATPSSSVVAVAKDDDDEGLADPDMTAAERGKVGTMMEEAC